MCKYRGAAVPPKGFQGVAVAGVSIHGGHGEICGILSSQGDLLPLCWQPDADEHSCPTALEETTETTGDEVGCGATPR